MWSWKGTGCQKAEEGGRSWKQNWILRSEGILNEACGKRRVMLNHGKRKRRKEGGENPRPDSNQFDGQQL